MELTAAHENQHGPGLDLSDPGEYLDEEGVVLSFGESADMAEDDRARRQVQLAAERIAPPPHRERSQVYSAVQNGKSGIIPPVLTEGGFRSRLAHCEAERGISL